MKILRIALFAVGLLPATVSHSRADLVNGGFETGNFSGWGVAGVSTVLGPAGSQYAHSGNFGASLGEGLLFQSLPTVAGHVYDINFWMKAIPGGDPQLLTVSWNSSSLSTDYGTVTLFTAPITEVGWADYDFKVLALSTVGTLTFEFQTQSVTYPNNVAVDDSSLIDTGMILPLPILRGVPIGSPTPELPELPPYLISTVIGTGSAVPEPSTYGLIGALALFAVALRRRLRR